MAHVEVVHPNSGGGETNVAAADGEFNADAAERRLFVYIEDGGDGAKESPQTVLPRRAVVLPWTGLALAVVVYLWAGERGEGR